MSQGNDLMAQVEFWKKEAEKYKKDLEAVQEEFSEFESNSRTLEQELEQQLDAAEKRNRELASANEKIIRERDLLRDKVEESQMESRKQISRLEDELERVTGQRDELQRYIRDLEQTNDDLDRAKRNAVVSLEDFEKRLNEAIERNAMLESELDEKEVLHTHIQRLKDQITEQRQELLVLEQKPPHHPPALMERGRTPPPKQHSAAEAMDTTPVHPTANGASSRSGIPRSVTLDGSGRNSPRPTTPSSSLMTPSARISALNIVGDLLRKVGALESRLASCRKYAAQSNPDDGSPRGPQAKQPHLSSEHPSRLPKLSPNAKIKS